MFGRNIFPNQYCQIEEEYELELGIMEIIIIFITLPICRPYKNTVYGRLRCLNLKKLMGYN